MDGSREINDGGGIDEQVLEDTDETEKIEQEKEKSQQDDTGDEDDGE
jgi:hypothetical protein